MADTGMTNSPAPTAEVLKKMLRIMVGWQGRIEANYFSAEWYSDQYKNNDIDRYLDIYKTECEALASSEATAMLDYFIHGWATGCRPNRFFDPCYYLANYPESNNSGMNPLLHYVFYGRFLGANPSADFDAQYYIQFNQDVAESRMDPLLHYLAYGRAEKRMTRAVTLHLGSEFREDVPPRSHFDPSSGIELLLRRAFSERRAV
ncbi:hypothetical+protein [Methylocapsa aurea]|jgi:hypothetical protein|uniref:hypothetical protein n=1 Tax=Methylocapsa aurea TaxID=663610 RepID=UPI003D18A558